MQSLSQSITHWFQSSKPEPLNPNNACVKAKIESENIDTAKDYLTVFGVRVQVNADTQIEDGRISANEYYVIDGFASTDGTTLIATGIERNHNANDVEIYGQAVLDEARLCAATKAIAGAIAACPRPYRNSKPAPASSTPVRARPAPITSSATTVSSAGLANPANKVAGPSRFLPSASKIGSK